MLRSGAALRRWGGMLGSREGRRVGERGGVVSVDRSGLWGEGRPQMSPVPLAVPGKSAVTPLTQVVYDLLWHRGPVSLDEFMRLVRGAWRRAEGSGWRRAQRGRVGRAQCLTHPKHGYYMTSDGVIGRQGDFVTSPEVSSLFSEMVAVWVASTWLQAGSPPHVRLVELGPGRGTLCHDVLRTLRRFRGCFEALSSVHLVEVSPAMRVRQAQTLRAVRKADAAVAAAEGDDDLRSSGREVCATRWLDPVAWGAPDGEQLGEFGPVVQWHEDLLAVPRDGMFIGVCHELFDAIGVVRVEKGADGVWREWLVDVDGFAPEQGGGPHHFRFVLSPNATPASHYFLAQRNISPLAADVLLATIPNATRVELDQLLPQTHDTTHQPPLPRKNAATEAPVPQPAVSAAPAAPAGADVWEELLPAPRVPATSGAAGAQEGAPEGWDALATPSVRGGNNRGDMRALEDMLAGIALRVKEVQREAQDGERAAASGPGAVPLSWVERAPKGTVVEYSNRASFIANEIAQRVAAQRGAALIVDYGRDGASSFSLRGIKGHEFVDVLQEIGNVDLSVDVDFRALRLAAQLVPHVTVRGPVTQSLFLHSLGILERAAQVLEDADDHDTQRIEAALRRLLHPDEMGHIYKAMSFAHPDVDVAYGFTDTDEDLVGEENSEPPRTP